jgi:hypothetical protein
VPEDLRADLDQPVMEGVLSSALFWGLALSSCKQVAQVGSDLIA